MPTNEIAFSTPLMWYNSIIKIPMPSKTVAFSKIAPALLVLAGLAFGYSALAQSPQPVFYFSWQAETLTPQMFAGKALPIEGSTVNASFELLRGGKPVDLTKNTVRWIVNGSVAREDLGTKSISFVNKLFSGNVISVQVIVLGLSGRDYSYAGTIPIVSPEITIRSPHDKDRVAARVLNLEGLPYFFNARALSELQFGWTVNGIAPAGTAAEPNKITIDIPDGTPSRSSIRVSAEAKSLKSRLENASNNLIYTLQ